jgi:predicted NBD/HSP70 family sugar kinase
MSIQSTIINHILKSPKSLSEIKEITQASLPTVRRAIKDLSESNWIRVVGQAEANGGRPAMLFGIDNQHYIVIGLHLQLPGIRLVAANLTGDVLKTKEFFQEIVPEPSLVVQTVLDFVSKIESDYPKCMILGVGIASPGFIDLSTGDIIAIGRVPSWVNFPICRHLSEMIHLPVRIANDVDCMAIAEFFHDQDPGKKNLVYVGFCEGVKASLFLGGQLYKGTIGNVGLISSNLLNLAAQGTQGDLHELITLPGFNQVFEKRVENLSIEKQKDYKNILSIENNHERFMAIVNAALTDAIICAPLVSDLIKTLSVAIAGVIFMIQPDILVIGGLINSAPKTLFIHLENAIRAHIPALINNNLIIKQGVMDAQNIAAIGAVHHFLQNTIAEILKEN